MGAADAIQRRLTNPVATLSGDVRRAIAWMRVESGWCPELEQPIFVTGTARSNTTLIGRVLAQNPSVTDVPGELIREWSTSGGTSIASPRSGYMNCPRLLDCCEADADAIRRGLCRAWLAAGGRGRLVNHNPHLAFRLPVVTTLFPDAAIVVTSRGLIGTVASLKRLWQEHYNRFGVCHVLPASDDCWSCLPASQVPAAAGERVFPGGDVRVLAEYWLRTYLVIADHPAQERFCHLRFSDFVGDPLLSLRNLESALALPATNYELELDQTRAASVNGLTSAEIGDLNDWVIARQDEISAIRIGGQPLSQEVPGVT